MEQTKLRIGIVGCGGIAHAHMAAYKRRIEKCDDIEVVAFCDIVPGRAESFMKNFGYENLPCYESHEEMLSTEKLDCVSVCTYNRQHAAPTICALEHGINVILEKPFSVTIDEAEAMMKAEKKSGKILTVGFQPRFDKNMQQIKRIVESGELGKVYYIQTGGGRRRGIPAGDTLTSFIMDETAGLGALGDIGCYSLDMVLNAIGYPDPLTVSGFKFDFFGKDPETYRYWTKDPEGLAEKFGVDDFAGALIRLDGGVIVDFRIAWAMNVDTPGDTIILGTKAGLRIPSTDCWNGSVGGPMTLYSQCAGQCVETVLPILHDGPEDGDLWDRKIGSFITAVREGSTAPVPTSQIVKNQAILSAIMESAQSGREVEVKLPRI